VVIWAVSTRRESDESLNAASLFMVKMFLASNKELKKTSIISKIAWTVVKVIFVFLKEKSHG